MRTVGVFAVATLLLAPAASAQVFRCSGPDARITYQDMPCAANEATHATDIPTQYPPPNDAERIRLLQREAALEARLEARRERESREQAMRLAAAPPSPPAPAVEEGYPVYFPMVAAFAYPRPRPHGAPRPRPVASPRF